MGRDNQLRKLEESGQLENRKKTKDAFMVLCTQYAQLGVFLNHHARALVKSVVADGDAAQTFQGTMFQYQEIGEQLKSVGMGLDALGGPPVLQPPPGGNGEQKG